MINVAIVGCAHIHTPGFIEFLQARPDVKVKCVWDHDTPRARKRAAELNTAVTSDLSVIWSDPDITAIIVCSETNRHQDLVFPAAAANKHLFVEKPLGYGSRDAAAMADAIERAGVIFQTGYFMRSQPHHLFIRDQIQKGNLGTLTRIRHSTCHRGSLAGWFDNEWRWMADPKIAGCGGFGDLGTHSLDIMIWLMGEVESVTAAIATVTRRYGECDEFGEGLIRFKNGAVGTLAASWLDRANPLTLLVTGTEGHAAVIDNNLYYVSTKVLGADGKKPWTDLPEELPHAFELFLDAITGKANVPLVTVREAAYRNAVMEAMYEGAARHTWVRPK